MNLSHTHGAMHRLAAMAMTSEPTPAESTSGFQVTMQVPHVEPPQPPPGNAASLMWGLVALVVAGMLSIVGLTIFAGPEALVGTGVLAAVLVPSVTSLIGAYNARLAAIKADAAVQTVQVVAERTRAASIQMTTLAGTVDGGLTKLLAALERESLVSQALSVEKGRAQGMVEERAAPLVPAAAAVDAEAVSTGTAAALSGVTDIIAEGVQQVTAKIKADTAAIRVDTTEIKAATVKDDDQEPPPRKRSHRKKPPA